MAKLSEDELHLMGFIGSFEMTCLGWTFTIGPMVARVAGSGRG